MIHVNLPDGATRALTQGTTAAGLASDISKSLAKRTVAAAVDGDLTDVSAPLQDGVQVDLIGRDDPRALEMIRHDLAHIMAEAVQILWPNTKTAIGPAIENGFYYDFERETPFTPEDLPIIEKKMLEIIAKREPFLKEIWTREQAKSHFEEAGEIWKLALLDAIPEDEPITIYRQGGWLDLCRGPHMRHTGDVGTAFKLMRVAGAYWRGDAKNQMLSRIYGIAFAEKADLDAHIKMMAEAEKRDHRKLGREMGLFHMQEEAPGQVFWHPNGWRIYTTLQDYMRRQQTRDGYVEVNTPQVVDRKLWEASGHWDKYQENMFIVEVDEEHAREKAINALKPMNCPCHVQIFNQGLKSYRDLPLRMAEFGSCNRYEPSGALHGIMRVRGFTQDDGHIFCREDQIEYETKKFINFLSTVYRDLGFESFSASSCPPARKTGSAAMTAGTALRTRCARRLRLLGTITLCSKVKVPFTGQSWNMSCVTRLDGTGSAAHCRSISTCQNGLARRMSPHLAINYPPLCCTGRSLAHLNASPES